MPSFLHVRKCHQHPPSKCDIISLFFFQLCILSISKFWQLLPPKYTSDPPVPHVSVHTNHHLARGLTNPMYSPVVPSQPWVILQCQLVDTGSHVKTLGWDFAALWRKWNLAVMATRIHLTSVGDQKVPFCSLSPPTFSLLPSLAASPLSAPSPCRPLRCYCLCLDGPSSNSANYSSFFFKIQAPLLLSHLVLALFLSHRHWACLFPQKRLQSVTISLIIHYLFPSRV